MGNAVIVILVVVAWVYLMKWVLGGTLAQGRARVLVVMAVFFLLSFLFK